MSHRHRPLTKLGALAGALLVCLTLAAGAARAMTVDPHPGPPVSRFESSIHVTVAAGDNLTTLAGRLGLPWLTIAAWNRLTDPDLIYPGQQLRLPPPGWRPTPGAYHWTPPTPPAPQGATGPRILANYTPAAGWTGPWACIARYESGGNPAENTGNGYYGGLQFSLATWYAYGGTGNPAAASINDQEAVAYRVLAAGGWGQWPNTSRMCGYR